MQKKNQLLMDFLLSRRSVSAKTLVEPVPDRSSLENILTAAARSPDHGKLVPWRFLILEKRVMSSIAKKILEIGVLNEIDPEKLNRNANTFLNSPLIVTVVSSPNSIKKIPIVEQYLSAGAVCLALLNAAHAEGWGANWLTGWMSYDKTFLKSVLDISENEFVAGFMHIGTKTIEPKERERPDIKSITSWLEV
jgi:nitroreductase